MKLKKLRDVMWRDLKAKVKMDFRENWEPVLLKLEICAGEDLKMWSSEQSGGGKVCFDLIKA